MTCKLLSRNKLVWEKFCICMFESTGEGRCDGTCERAWKREEYKEEESR